MPCLPAVCCSPALFLFMPCLTAVCCSPTQMYAPSRTVTVFGPAQHCDKDADAQPSGIPGLGVKGLGPYYER